MLKNAGNWLRKISLARKQRKTHFSPKQSSAIKIYLFEIKCDFLDRTVDLFLCFCVPLGSVQVYEQKVWSAGATALQHYEQNRDSLKCVAKKRLKERIACIANGWYSDLMPGSVLEKASWQQVDNSVKFIWRVFGYYRVLKCLDHGLPVKLNVYFSCRAGYMYLCVTWK